MLKFIKKRKLRKEIRALTMEVAEWICKRERYADHELIASTCTAMIDHLRERRGKLENEYIML